MTARQERGEILPGFHGRPINRSGILLQIGIYRGSL
jgi:hypothetical protein